MLYAAYFFLQLHQSKCLLITTGLSPRRAASCFLIWTVNNLWTYASNTDMFVKLLLFYTKWTQKWKFLMYNLDVRIEKTNSTISLSNWRTSSSVIIISSPTYPELQLTDITFPINRVYIPSTAAIFWDCIFAVTCSAKPHTIKNII